MKIASSLYYKAYLGRDGLFIEAHRQKGHLYYVTAALDAGSTSVSIGADYFTIYDDRDFCRIVRLARRSITRQHRHDRNRRRAREADEAAYQ